MHATLSKVAKAVHLPKGRIALQDANGVFIRFARLSGGEKYGFVDLVHFGNPDHIAIQCRKPVTLRPTLKGTTVLFRTLKIEKAELPTIAA